MSTKPITADILLRDIRAHCLDCMGNQRSMVALCTSKKCRLWRWRLPPEEMGRVIPLRPCVAPPLEGGAYGLQLSMVRKEAEACGP